jgi:hypothetical protein
MYTALTFAICAALYAAISYWWPNGGIIVWLTLGIAWLILGKIGQFAARLAQGFVRNPVLDTVADARLQGRRRRFGGALWTLGLTLRMPLWQTAWAGAASTLGPGVRLNTIQGTPFKIPSTLARFYSLGACSAILLLVICAFFPQSTRPAMNLAVVLLTGLIAGLAAWALVPQSQSIHFRRNPGKLTSQWVILGLAAFIELATLICVVRGYRTPAAVWSVLTDLVTTDWTGLLLETRRYKEDPLNILVLLGGVTYSVAIGSVIFDWLRGGLERDDEDVLAIATTLNGVGLFDDAIAWLERIEHRSIRSAMQKAAAYLGKGDIDEAARIATAAMSIAERETPQHNPLGVPTSGIGALLTAGAEIPIPSTHVIAMFKRYLLTSPSDEEVTLMLMASSPEIIKTVADAVASEIPSHYVLTRCVCFPELIATAPSLASASGVTAIITAAVKLRAGFAGDEHETFAAKRLALTGWMTTEFKRVQKAVWEELETTHDCQLAFIAMSLVLGMSLEAVVSPKDDLRRAFDLIRDIEVKLKDAGLQVTPGMFEESVTQQLKVFAKLSRIRPSQDSEPSQPSLPAPSS